jgi:hypothetical protein
MNPTGSRTMTAGIRNLLARTCEPTASANVRPTPKKTWSALMASVRGGGASQPFVGHDSAGAYRGDQLAIVALVLVGIGLRELRDRGLEPRASPQVLGDGDPVAGAGVGTGERPTTRSCSA